MKPHEHNDDEQWEDIVRRLGGSQDLEQTDPSVDPVPQEATHQPEPPVQGPRDYHTPDEIVEDFTPPEPRPIASGNPRTVLSWVGVVGAAGIWILAALLGWPLPWWLSAVSIAGFVGGAISLFFLLPKSWANRDPFDSDDYGDGAKL